jgi:hypothetical protein
MEKNVVKALIELSDSWEEADTKETDYKAVLSAIVNTRGGA